VFFVQLHFTTRVRYGFLSVQLNYTIRQQKLCINSDKVFWNVLQEIGKDVIPSQVSRIFSKMFHVKHFLY